MGFMKALEGGDMVFTGARIYFFHHLLGQLVFSLAPSQEVMTGHKHIQHVSNTLAGLSQPKGTDRTRSTQYQTDPQLEYMNCNIPKFRSMIEGLECKLKKVLDEQVCLLIESEPVLGRELGDHLAYLEAGLDELVLE